MKMSFRPFLILIAFTILLVCVKSEKLEKNTTDPEFVELYQVKHLQQGDDTNYPKPGHLVSVHYVGTFPGTGKKFDSSIDRRTPFSFVVRRGQVIQCWDEVVSRMSKGEKIYVVCPARFAYGERGAGGVIPPNADIAFEIELLETDVEREDL